jgi:hypothetical protein
MQQNAKAMSKAEVTVSYFVFFIMLILPFARMLSINFLLVKRLHRSSCLQNTV